MINDRERLELLRSGRDRQAFLFAMAVCALLAYIAEIPATAPILIGTAVYWLHQLLTTTRAMRGLRRGP